MSEHQDLIKCDCTTCKLRASGIAVPPGHLDPIERKFVDDIAEFGCHITAVHGEGDIDNGFAYSTGLFSNYGHPEIIVFGQNQVWQQSVINAALGDIKQGKSFRDGEICDDFIPPFKITFRAVPTQTYPSYMGWSIWYYDTFHPDNAAFEATQLVWPDKQHRFPWDLEYDGNPYKQPVLAAYDWILDGDDFVPVVKR